MGIENRLNAIEERLAIIESHLGILAKKPRSIATPTESLPPQEQGTEKPGNWLGIVAIICFVFAAGFIIKLSIDSGWLTPVRQLGLAGLFGLSLIVSGFTLIKSDQEYASLLPAGGIVVLYLTTFAAHRYYGLISIDVAIALVMIVSGLCTWLYKQMNHDVYVVMAAVGAYCSPLILVEFKTHTEFSLYYFLICSLAFSCLSLWAKSRTLHLLSAYFAILMSALVGLNLQQDVLVASILALQFLVFSLGAYIYTKKYKVPLTVREAYAFLPVLLSFYGVEYYFIDNIQPGIAPWISLGFAGILMGLYLSAKKHFSQDLGSKSLIWAFVTLVIFHSAYLDLLPRYLELFPSIVSSWLFVAIMFGMTFAPLNFLANKRTGALYIPFLAVLMIMVIEYATMIVHLFMGTKDLSWLIVSFAALASIWSLIVKETSNTARQDKFSFILLGAAHVLAIIGLYRLTEDVSSLAVSASWLFYAVGVIAFAFHLKEKIMAKSALFVLSLAAGKALLFDAASAPTLLRIFCLLLTGTVLYGCGLLIRKIGSWNPIQ